jgi:uncharacterized membrane protein HdeD (DUF308 family)
MASDRLTNEELRVLKAPAWLFMLAGLVSVAAGVIVLLKPSDSLVTLSVIAGIFILVDGLFDVIGSFSRRTENRGLAAVVGVLSVVVGVLLIRHPLSGVLAAALLIGIWLLAGGVVRIVRAFDGDHVAWRVIVGLLEAAAGIVLISSPAISFSTLALLVGISFIVYGVGEFALGWMLHGLREDTESPAFSAGAPA